MMLLAYLIPIGSNALKGQSIITPSESFLKILCGYASYSLVLNLFDHKDVSKLIKALLYAVMVTMTMVLYQLITGYGIYVAQDRFIQGFYHDPGQYTRMALMGIIILLPTFRTIKGNIDFWLKILILTLCTITLGLSISRNVILTVACTLIVYCLLWRKIAISLFIIIVSFLLYYSSPVVQEIYTKKTSKEAAFLKGDEVRAETLGSGRIGMWNRTLEEFKENNLLNKLFGIGKGIGPHGEFYNLLRSVGLYGLLITIILYFKLLYHSFRAAMSNLDDKPATYSFLFAVAIIIMSLFSAPLTNFYLQIIFFAFVALTEKTRLSQEKDLRHTEIQAALY